MRLRLKRLAEVRGGEVEQMSGRGLQVVELERADAGQTQSQLVFPGLRRVGETVSGDSVERGE